MSKPINADEYHNIVYSPEVLEIVQKAPGYNKQITLGNAVITEVVIALAKAQPTWRFVISRGYIYGTGSLKCNEVTVTIDGEDVGALKDDYARGRSCVRITGHKIETTRSSDPKRALTICRKAFVKRNNIERIRMAETEAGTMISNRTYRTRSEITALKTALSAAAFTYAMEVARESFESQLLESQREQLNKYDETSVHMATIESVREKFEKHQTALVIRDGSRYIVKIGDDVALYEASLLPDSMRGKVGMLKLCEDGQMVDDVGCRVSDEVFVVVLSEGVSDA